MLESSSLVFLKGDNYSKADPNDVSSNNANLVWNACYFGKLDILKHLLSLKVDYSLCGQSQDARGSLGFVPQNAVTF